LNQIWYLAWIWTQNMRVEHRLKILQSLKNKFLNTPKKFKKNKKNQLSLGKTRYSLYTVPVAVLTLKVIN